MRVKVNLREERGATLVFVAISLFVLLALAALSVDFGLMFSERRAMVNANDSGALAFAESCALKRGQADADAKADELATANVASATRNGQPIWPVEGSCDGKGSVTVSYITQQKLLFAPAIGLDSQQIGAGANAAWGPAGGAGGVLPVMVSAGRLSTCDIPSDPGTECWFYENNGPGGLGNASWALLNVQPVCADGHFGWDVRVSRCSKVKNPDPTYACPSFTPEEMIDIINNGSVPLSMNPSGVTFVCTATGQKTPVWVALKTREGHSHLFPVNDPSKQIKNGGALAPPPATPDFYGIVGFIQMKIVDVWNGKDAEWDSRCPSGTDPLGDPNAWCLHTIWEGFSTEPGPICDACEDFGVGAIALRG
jgi:Flp pilus assembly protein TadG